MWLVFILVLCVKGGVMFCVLGWWWYRVWLRLWLGGLGWVWFCVIVGLGLGRLLGLVVWCWLVYVCSLGGWFCC